MVKKEYRAGVPPEYQNAPRYPPARRIPFQGQHPVQPEVELLPWTHVFTAPEQVSVVNYIQKMPKNTCLLMEISPNQLNAYYQAILENPPRLTAKHFQNTVEILLACKKKNIQIIPMESHAKEIQVIKKRLSSNTAPDSIEGLLTQMWNEEQAHMKREETFAQTIISTLKNLRKRKVYVLTGAAHILPLAEKLSAQKIKTTINTDILPTPERKQTNAIMANTLEWRKKLNSLTGRKANETEIAKEITGHMQALRGKLGGTWDLTPLQRNSEKLQQDTKQRAIMQQKRWKKHAVRSLKPR